jgi:very-short-patch-repair endonuclease
MGEGWGEGDNEDQLKHREKTTLSRKLRKEQTEAERMLWAKLKGYQLAGLKFRRQEPIGTYIVDFVCFEKKIVIEVDGGQHGTESIRQKDAERTLWLEGEGFRILRFWNNDVLTNMEGVLEIIKRAVDCEYPLT